MDRCPRACAIAVIAVFITVFAGFGLSTPAADATTVENYYYYDDHAQQYYGSTGVLGGEKENDLVVRFQPRQGQHGAYLIVDSRRVREGDTQADCTRLTPRRLRCPVPATPEGVSLVNLTVQAEAGADRVRYRGPAPQDKRSFPYQERGFDGGVGDDVIVGSARDDGLEGGPGGDVLRAGGGDDWLDYAGGVEARGADVLFGGGGDDLLWAGGRSIERRIDCGDGEQDEAIITARQPSPEGCEEVRRRKPFSP